MGELPVLDFGVDFRVSFIMEGAGMGPNSA